MMVVAEMDVGIARMLKSARCNGIALVKLTSTAGEIGKETLYPVATVIVGGILSWTLLDCFVHPASFWVFGRKEAERHIHDTAGPDELDGDLPHAGTIEISSTRDKHAPAGSVVEGGMVAAHG